MADFPPAHPGDVLRKDFLKPLKLSQYALAKAIDVPQIRVSELINRLGTRSFWIWCRTPSARRARMKPAHRGLRRFCCHQFAALSRRRKNCSVVRAVCGWSFTKRVW